MKGKSITDLEYERTKIAWNVRELNVKIQELSEERRKLQALDCSLDHQIKYKVILERENNVAAQEYKKAFMRNKKGLKNE